MIYEFNSDPNFRFVDLLHCYHQLISRTRRANLQSGEMLRSKVEDEGDEILRELPIRQLNSSLNLSGNALLDLKLTYYCRAVGYICLTPGPISM
ncbi:unnamed protein product [Lathyrus oleraceus]